MYISFGLRLTNRGCQDQDLCNSRNARRLLVLGAKSAERISASLPDSGHDDDPAEAVLVLHCLAQMRDQKDAEKNGKRNCRGEVREVHPQGVT